MILIISRGERGGSKDSKETGPRITVEIAEGTINSENNNKNNNGGWKNIQTKKNKEKEKKINKRE